MISITAKINASKPYIFTNSNGFWNMFRGVKDAALLVWSRKKKSSQNCTKAHDHNTLVLAVITQKVFQAGRVADLIQKSFLKILPRTLTHYKESESKIVAISGSRNFISNKAFFLNSKNLHCKLLCNSNVFCCCCCCPADKLHENDSLAKHSWFERWKNMTYW